METQSQPQAHTAPSGESKPGHHLPHPHHHMHPNPQYAIPHADDHPNQQKSNSGRSTPNLHYKVHQTPQFYSSGHATVGAGGGALTAEQEAEHLTQYNREHADQLAQNRASHGGHAEGDEYTPSRAAHHHPHFHYHMHQAPQFYSAGSVPHDKPKSGTSTPKEGSGVHLPHYHMHQAPQFYSAGHASQGT